jgi:serine/threonine protein kinase
MLAGATPFYWEGLDETSLFQSIAEDEYPALPDTVSAEAVHLIAGLLTKDPRKRLGSRSESDILQHKWLQTLDLVALRRKQVQAPWVPDVSDALDASCFDNWDQLEDRVSQHYPTLMKKEAALFDSF